MSTATPIYFGPADRPLFGWVHQPADRMARGTVVLCPPLHREYISAHYTFRVLTERLTERGITAIRFDYDGTGDSVGSGADPGRVAAYEASVDQAIALADDLGTADLVLVGMRMGGLLAARAIARAGRPAGLVLWDPCGSGREFLRGQSALFRLTYGKAKRADGGTEVAGFVLTAETTEQLGAMTAPESNPTVERALLLTRPDRSPAGAFGVDESRLESAVAEGQAELMDTEPFFSIIPASTETITDWIDAGLPPTRTGQKAPEGRTQITVSATDGSPAVTERLVHLGPAGLFGIVTTGTTQTGPWIVLLTSGNESHIGPNRMWVDLARQWAAIGLRCVRFDLSGMGDSPARPGRPGHIERAPEAFQDVEDAIEALTGTSLSRSPSGSSPPHVAPAVLVGLCSGAYQALDSGIDLRTAGAIAVNPVLRFPPPESKEGALHPRRTLARPVDESLRSAYNRLPDWKVLRVARKGYMAAARVHARQKTATAWLTEMSDRQTDVLCICGRMEADALFEGGRVPTGPQVELGPHAVVEIIEDLDHGLIPERYRTQVADMMTAHLVAHHLDGGADAGAAPSSTPAPADLVP